MIKTIILATVLLLVSCSREQKPVQYDDLIIYEVEYVPIGTDNSFQVNPYWNARFKQGSVIYNAKFFTKPEVGDTIYTIEYGK